MRTFYCFFLFMGLVIFDTALIHAEQMNGQDAPGNNFWKAIKPPKIKKRKIKDGYGKKIKTSLIIPCYYGHARQLYALLRMYEEQTRLPDEVVISLSEAHLVDAEIFEQLQNELWVFPVTVVVSKKKKYAGENRNTACEYARGDIFICQDADDIPHPQRVEIIHYFFNTYDIDHLMHEYRRIQPDEASVPFQVYEDVSQVQFGCLRDFSKIWHAAQFTNGNVAVARHVLKKLQWPNLRRGQDTEFNREVYRQYKNCIIIRAILHGYREFLSSAKKDRDNGEISVVPVHHEVREKRYALKVVKA